MTAREVSVVFSNIDTLYPIHVEILASLERARQSHGAGESVGDIFMQIVCRTPPWDQAVAFSC
jgi:hypothetical protein